MNSTIEDLLSASGWSANDPSNPHIWSKNATVFDTVNDIITVLNGVTINFKNHGDGLRLRFSCAETLAIKGTL